MELANNNFKSKWQRNQNTTDKTKDRKNYLFSATALMRLSIEVLDTNSRQKEKRGEVKKSAEFI